MGASSCWLMSLSGNLFSVSLNVFVGDSTSEMLVSMAGCPLDDFYPAVAISALMRILKDPNLSNHHTMVIQAVTLIFKSLGMKCVQFVPQVCCMLACRLTFCVTRRFVCVCVDYAVVSQCD